MAKITKSIDSPGALVRHVFNKADIDVKTDLNPTQIQAINILKTTGYLFGSPFFVNHINHFMQLQKSKERKSLGEFVTALRSLREQIADKADKAFHLLG